MSQVTWTRDKLADELDDVNSCRSLCVMCHGRATEVS